MRIIAFLLGTFVSLTGCANDVVQGKSVVDSSTATEETAAELDSTTGRDSTTAPDTAMADTNLSDTAPDVADACRAPCEWASSCGCSGGQTCGTDGCTAAGSIGFNKECGTAAMCARGLWCFAGRCQLKCDGSAPGTACTTALSGTRCEGLVSGSMFGVCTGYCDPAAAWIACGAATCNDHGGTIAMYGASTLCASPSGTKRQGETCTTQSECAVGHKCLQTADKTKTLCWQWCDPAAPGACPTPLKCCVGPTLWITGAARVRGVCATAC